jgi:hypothetical protein
VQGLINHHEAVPERQFRAQREGASPRRIQRAGHDSSTCHRARGRDNLRADVQSALIGVDAFGVEAPRGDGDGRQ